MSKSYSEIFEAHFGKWKSKRIALYGTGVIAREILDKCKNINIIGVYDRDLNEGTICDFPILNILDMKKDGIEAVVVAAQAENIRTIYNRIYGYADMDGIGIYDICGEDLVELYGKADFKLDPEMNCFEYSKDKLKGLIREHDIISFDIFDTIIMRQVYGPHDVFMMVQDVANAKKIEVDSFYANRIQAEINLIKDIPTLEELYKEVQRLTGITDYVKEQLMQIEIDMERHVIIPRKEMVQILKEAIGLGKAVYLITDMYLPTGVLEKILTQNGITGYRKIYNSCDFHRPKVGGLFEIFASQIKGGSYLHIGDHAQADGMCAKKAGMESFVVQKASAMCEQIFFRRAGYGVRTWNEKLLYGIVISRLFNNPFCMGKNNKIYIEHVEDLVFCAVAPVVSVFIQWLKGVQKKENKTILFASRDGWLLKELLEEEGKNIGIYFYTSRIACLVCRTSRSKKENYKKYLDSLMISNKKKYLFFDLASSGTCLSELVDNFGLNLKGIFLYRYDSGNQGKGYLDILSYLPENPHSGFWRNYKFFEFILTSPEPSLESFDEEGMPIFEDEHRNSVELRQTFRLQEEVRNFYKIYHSWCDGSPVDTNLLDMTISVLDRDKSCVEGDAVKNLCIYDSYGVGKIKIFDS